MHFHGKPQIWRNACFKLRPMAEFAEENCDCGGQLKFCNDESFAELPKVYHCKCECCSKLYSKKRRYLDDKKPFVWIIGDQ